MKSIKGQTLIELVATMAILSQILLIIIYITRYIYIFTDKMKLETNINSDVDTLNKLFNEIDINALNKTIKVETLDDTKPIIKMYIDDALVCTIYNYDTVLVKYNNQTFKFNYIEEINIYSNSKRIIYIFKDKAYKYHKIVYNFNI